MAGRCEGRRVDGCQLPRRRGRVDRRAEQVGTMPICGAPARRHAVLRIVEARAMGSRWEDIFPTHFKVRHIMRRSAWCHIGIYGAGQGAVQRRMEVSKDAGIAAQSGGDDVLVNEPGPADPDFSSGNAGERAGDHRQRHLYGGRDPYGAGWLRAGLTVCGRRKRLRAVKHCPSGRVSAISVKV